MAPQAPPSQPHQGTARRRAPAGRGERLSASSSRKEDCHRGGGDQEREGADRDRRIHVRAQLRVHGALHRQHRPGGKAGSHPAAAVAQSAVERFATGLRAHDHPGGDDDRDRTGQGGRAERLTLDAQPARAVEQERGGHLAGYEETDGDERAKAREEQDAGRDVDGAADPAPQVRGLCVRQRTEGAERADHRREREQQARADRELERGRADRAADGTGQLHVGARLERQEAADNEEEGDREGFHVETVRFVS